MRNYGLFSENGTFSQNFKQCNDGDQQCHFVLPPRLPPFKPLPLERQIAWKNPCDGPQFPLPLRRQCADSTKDFFDRDNGAAHLAAGLA